MRLPSEKCYSKIFFIFVPRYIDHLILNRKGIQVWQERSIACMQLLRNEEQKLKVALKIARIAPVPWSDVMRPIVELQNSSHKIAEEIASEYSHNDFKLLLTKYNWRSDNTGFVDYIKFAQRIIKENSENLFAELE